MAGRSIASAEATLDANGRGVAVLPSVPAWEVWELSRLTVATTGGSASVVPSCVVYEGSEAGGRRLDATYSGNGDVSDFSSPLELPAGMFLTVVWSDGSSGERGRVELYGTRRRVGR